MWLGSPPATFPVCSAAETCGFWAVVIHERGKCLSVTFQQRSVQSAKTLQFSQLKPLKKHICLGRVS